jgi:RNA polymerase sigma-70 factor (ECF subfamily)
MRTSSSANDRSYHALTQDERDYAFSVAMKYMKDEEAAADVAQDALLLAHRYRDSFRGDSLFTTWLYRITATTSLMHLRRQRRLGREVHVTTREDEPSYADTRPSGGATPAEQLEQAEQVARALDGVARLGDKYGAVFTMRYVEGYTESEIADHLHLTLATVKTRAHRARLAAQARLEENEENEPLAA